MGPLVATSVSLYQMRALEPLLGPRKFGAFVVVTSILALPFEATAGVYFNTVRLTPGPLPLVFALLVVYHVIVPPGKQRAFGFMGMDFSDKTFTFCVAGMLACCEGWASCVPAICGAFVGGLYVLDTMSIQSVRLPNLVYRCLSRLCGVLRTSRHRRGTPSPFASGVPPRLRSATRRTRPTGPLIPSPREAGGNLLSFFTRRRRRSQGSDGLRRTASPSRTRAPPPPPPEQAVTALTGMGFERAAVLQALAHTGNDSFGAANILLSRAGTTGVGSREGPADSVTGSGGSASAPPHDHSH